MRKSAWPQFLAAARRRGFMRLSVLLLCALLAGWAAPVRAAGPGTVMGRVTDPSGLPVANAVVTAVAAAQGSAASPAAPSRVLSARSDAAGVYSQTSGTVTSTMAGKYVKVTDSCGSISLSGTAPADLTFGTSSGTDCTTPGSGGAGTSNHLGSELLKSMTKIDMVHVPYKGASQAMLGLIGGQIDMVVIGTPSAQPMVQAGKVNGVQNSLKHESTCCP